MGNYAEYSYPDKGPNLGLFELGVGWQIRLFIYNQNRPTSTMIAKG